MNHIYKGTFLLVLGFVFCLFIPVDAHANSTPVNDFATTAINMQIVINVTGNDIGANLSVGNIGTPTNGSVIDNEDGTITYIPPADFNGVVTFNYTLLQNALYSNDTGHYYEFVTASAIDWQDARDAAANRTLYGLQGYLATVTSSAENSFIANRLEGQGWMGASDEASEGNWTWVTGPENGTQFWQGNGGGSVVGGQYNRWASGEPNDAGGEDHAHYLANGQWNDYRFDNNGIQGYVVEYGGLGGDNPSFLVANVTVYVNDTQAPNVTFLSPTLANNTYVNQTNTTINISIYEHFPQQFTFTWNGTDYSLYDSSLLLFMSFNNVSALSENSTRAVDVSLYNNNATMTSTTVTSCIFLLCHAFNGTASYGTIPHSSENKASDAITVSAWVMPQSLHDDYQWVLRDGWSGNPIHLAINEQNRFIFAINDEASMNTAAGAPLATVDEWQHVVGTYDGSIVRVYLDGVEQWNLSYSTAIGSGSQPYIIGAADTNANSQGDAGFFNGSIDQLMLWNRSLSSAEIALLYDTQFSKHNKSTWSLSFNFSDLSEAQYNYSLFGNDTSGNSSNYSRRFTLDHNAPVVNAISPVNNTTYNATTNITLIANVTDIAAQYVNATVVYPNASFVVYPMSLNANGTWNATFPITVDEGNYTVYYFAWDYIPYNGSSQNVTIIMDPIDLDNDGIPDERDTFIAVNSSTNTNITGVNNLNITVSGNASNGTFSGELETLFYDGSTLFMNFTHNYSESTVDLSRFIIQKTSTSLLISTDGQLTLPKTLYLESNSYDKLCVKDAPIVSIDNVSSSCTDANETNFISCVGNSSVVTIDGITCSDDGTIITVGNLTHSAIKANLPSSVQSSSSSSGGGGGSSTRPPVGHNITLDIIANKTAHKNLTQNSYVYLVLDDQIISLYPTWNSTAWHLKVEPESLAVERKENSFMFRYNEFVYTVTFEIYSRYRASIFVTQNSASAPISQQEGQTTIQPIISASTTESPVVEEEEIEMTFATKFPWLIVMLIILALLFFIILAKRRKKKHKQVA